MKQWHRLHGLVTKAWRVAAEDSRGKGWQWSISGVVKEALWGGSKGFMGQWQRLHREALKTLWGAGSGIIDGCQHVIGRQATINQ